MKRLFFGLSVDPIVGAGLLRTSKGALERQDHGILYHEDDLHLTLCFLGEFPATSVASLTRAGNDEFRGLWAPELYVGGEGGAFPSRQAPRALYAGVEEAPDSLGRLSTLRNRTHQVALSHGWREPQAERARPFRPHVTVGRLGPDARCDLSDFWELGSQRKWLPLDITLYESRPDRHEGSSRYEPLAAWPLAVRPG